MLLLKPTSSQVLENPTPKEHLRPLITSLQVIIVGSIAYFLASIWPPLLLLAAACLAAIFPNLFYERDDAESRRRLYREFLRCGNLPEELKCNDVDLVEKYWANSRGMCLSTSIMKPKPTTPIRAVICFCHGFLGSSSYLIRCEYQRYVKAGIAFVAIDYEGHGLSDGLHGLIPSWDLLVGDCAAYFQQALGVQFPNTPAFLCGESMGGAVCFSIYERNPSLWKGVVFVAPMCKIKQDMLPPLWVIKLFMAIVGETGVTTFSKLPIAPSKKSLLNDVFRSERKKEMAKSNPLFYGDRKPRLASARELLKVSDELSSRIKNFDAPFLVQHGLADVVTDPNLSKALYEESPSKDKSIKLYEGMWHSINIGESEDNLQIVHQDAIDWILERSH